MEADEIEDDDSDETIEQSSVPSQTRNHPFLPQERERDERREEEVGLGVGKDGSGWFFRSCSFAKRIFSTFTSFLISL